MKNTLPRFLLLALSAAALVLSTGCAEFAQGLALAADNMQAQQQGSYGSGDGYYEHTARNTSAPGIK